MTETQEPNWWQGAAIYQIYPRSYLDTTGNGVGDLKGISEKLPHIAELGADAVWISPFVRSPMLDFGYDVSDYRAVDPLFGTLEDFQALLDRAHELGLKIIMDQVLSHTSNQHPWFLESREGRENAKADWYVWADPKKDGTVPNNWLSVFGGSSWQWEPRRGQYYLHNFLREQPDLNYHNPEVQDAVLDVCRFWLDMGVDGFRLDVCAFYFHDSDLRDNPDNPDINPGAHFRFNPYSMQRHTRDIAQPENLAFLERLRALSDAYEDRALLGELHEGDGARLHREYTAPDRLQLAYGYWFLGADEIDAGLIRDTAAALGHETRDGWPCWALDNHDFHRAVTRLGKEDCPEAVTVILAALTCLRGACCIYQGSELGLAQAHVPYDRIVDPYGREFYPSFQGRDGARTPMPWEGGEPHGGFSKTEPWLPVPPEHLDRAVDRQKTLPGSTRNQMSRFLNWRREQPALRHGGMAFLDLPQPVLGLTREHGGETVTCLFNLGADEAVIEMPETRCGAALEGHGFGAPREGDLVRLPAHGAFFASTGGAG
ncbi:alpha-glucosidase [Palleronia salina]|uniref:Alpha-glucosidase n=1 Tax=Palleronia salina TaxID=313368 RepID=A0A1M6LQ11_9RHOB|nr:alpha-glucosidase [Palleronia salina]SHJ73240.1 alpha-glucosidase [Palleronia salina]